MLGMMALVAGLFGSSAANPQAVEIGSGSVTETVLKLRPGEYVWAAELAPRGPLLLIVNLKTQRALLFRNGIPIGASTVSTGRPGYSTPTGVFTILQKRVEHYSSTYDNAPMPFMQRLTWRGVALHAGNLPGYPASHGCIRLPLAFARLLYGVTAVGMTVVITDQPATPRIASPPIIGDPESGIAPDNAAVEWHPEKSPSGPLSIIVSAADGRATVLRNGIVIGSAPVKIEGPPTGTWAYSLREIGPGGKQHWVRLSLGGDAAKAEAVPRDEWRRYSAPDWFRRAIAAEVQPGTTVIVTSDSLRTSNAGSAVTVLEDAPSPRP
jgi:hypothetical protein